MPCKLDVRKAILNKVMDEAVEGRYTFQRTSDDTVIITNVGKAKSSEQAKAIAKSLADRISESFYGHVKGEVNQSSAYDPITVKFNVSQAYIDHVYNELPVNKRTEGEQADRERDYVNTNTGPNTYEQMALFSVEPMAVGSFNKYVTFKQGQLNEYKARLGKVQADKKKFGLSVEELNRLSKEEKELKFQINGSDDLKKMGLKQEIAELTKNGDVNAIGYYAEKDMARLAKLVNSGNIDHLQEAQKLIDFYEAAGTFIREIENPFFTQEEMFVKDDNGELTDMLDLPNSVVETFGKWKEKATKFRSNINTRHKELLVNTVNSDPSVKNTYGDKKFTYNEIVNGDTGLKDTDWISMWTMDVTNGIFSHNGVLPQIMFSYLANSIEKKNKWSREIHEKIDAMNPKVHAELMKMGYSLRGSGILGLKGASFQLFKEITKEGNETGGLVQRFVKEFFDTQARALNNFTQKFEAARLYEDYGERTAAVNKAFNEVKQWRRQNTIIMDINRLPEFRPGADNIHKDELVAILGEKGYKEQVARQQNMLNKFESEKQFMTTIAMEAEGVDTSDQLSDDSKQNLNYWEKNNSPFTGIEDYNSAAGVFDNNRKVNNFMSYNNFIPRKNKVSVSVVGEKFNFTNTTEGTGFYSEAYSKIEANSLLNDYYDVIREVCEKIREEMPYEMQQSVAANTIPALAKSSAEMLVDKDLKGISPLFAALKKIYERLRLGFGVNKQSELSYATIDPITRKANYKVNDDFLRGNSGAVRDRMNIEKIKFLQAANRGKPEGQRLEKISRFTSFQLDKLNEEQLILISEYLHIDISLADIKTRRLDAIRNITSDTVEVGKYIRDYSLHTVVQSQSFDLSKIAKYFSDVTMLYSARKESLPLLNIIKKHYENIHKPKTNNIGNNIHAVIPNQTLLDGLRVRGNMQMEDWFERVVLGNYSTKHAGVHGLNSDLDKIGDKLSDRIKTSMPNYGKTIYSDEDKKKIKEIDELLKTETNEKKREQLLAMKEGMGKLRTATAVFDNILGWIRTMRLGYNLSSATTNLMEGVTSNMILASLNQFFDAKEIYYGYGVVKHSFLKNASFGMIETKAGKKNRALMDKFNVIMDSRNELQKSSMKTHADRLSWLNPHALNQRVEYINQSPIMIAMLRSKKITDQNGNESSLWDAFSPDGQLKDEFRTEENISNWEEMSGDIYLNFKQNLHKAIVLAHGNYDELRGMMIKSSSAGKALAMFKTWLPMQIYQRLATEQDDIQSGEKGFKGRYRSYTTAGGFVHGSTVGAAIFGPIGFLAGGVIGGGLAKFYGIKSEVSTIKQLLDSYKFLFKKALGVPTNLITGIAFSKSFIDAGGKDFKKWESAHFSEQDAKNMRGNMADIAMQLSMLALILLVKSLLWDDDDDPDDPSRMAHNVLINKLMQLSSQASLYVNPLELANTLTTVAAYQYCQEVGKTIGSLQGVIDDDDLNNRGESKLGIHAKKVFMPGLFKDGIPGLGGGYYFGFKSQAERVFNESPYHKYFKSEEALDKARNTAERAKRRLELGEELNPDMFEGETKEEQEKAMKKQIKQQVDEELPTQSRLKKLGLTREEFDTLQKEE